MHARLPVPGVAFLAGAALGAVISGGLVEERLSAGSVPVGAVVNALITLAAIVTLGLLYRRGAHAAPLVVLPQAVGAAVGVIAVHLALRCGWVHGAAWLAERPAQLVNDAVEVFAILTVVWACANRWDPRLLAVALAVALLYRVTGSFWHLDAAPRGFLVTVQDLVMAQLACAALALPLYERMTRSDLAR
jgi:hypothetical protein